MQVLFLSFLTIVLLPLLFKWYGTIFFGKYATRLRTGFDQALYRRDEGRLFQSTA